MDRIFSKYLKISVVTVAASLIVLAGVSLKALFFDHIFMYQKLYNYQINKIAASRDVQTLLVGDSSLGNSVDAGYFSELSSSKTLNLALTGVYGYGGAYNMIKKAIKHNPVKNVVVMFQSNTLAMPLTYEGYLYTWEGPHDLTAREWLALGKTFLNVTLAPYSFINIAKHYLGLLDTGSIEGDYVKQAPRVAVSGGTSPIEGKVLPEQGLFLRKLSDFCSRRNINLVYAHGPLLEDGLREPKQAVDQMDAFIRQQGIIAVVGPVPISRNEVGDTFDHVYPAAKHKYTQIYYNLLKGFLL